MDDVDITDSIIGNDLEDEPIAATPEEVHVPGGDIQCSLSCQPMMTWLAPIAAVQRETAQNSGSAWESNPPTLRLTQGPAVLKTVAATRHAGTSEWAEKSKGNLTPKNRLIGTGFC